jgi:hypothetical protein
LLLQLLQGIQGPKLGVAGDESTLDAASAQTHRQRLGVEQLQTCRRPLAHGQVKGIGA